MSTLNLTKGNPVIDLRKSDSTERDGEVRIFTGWSSAQGLDLDQGFMWEALNGQKGCVQALGGDFGSRQRLPHLELLGDDRSGGQGETILGGYAAILRDLKRVSLYLYNYSGETPLSRVQDAFTEIHVPGFRPVRLTHEDQGTRTCAVLQLRNTGDGLRIEREMYSVPTVRGSSPQKELDRHWGYGFTWRSASK